jgi:NADPH2:quinone reductase
MKAGWYSRNGSAAEVLEVGTLPDPAPGPGEVRVRLKTSGVNPSDVKSRAGRPLTAPRVTPHSDGAGVIDAVGEGVAPARVGERVWIWNGAWKRPAGTAAQFIVLPQAQAVLLPEATTFEEGACLGIPALTALHAVTGGGSILGATVLVQGGAGAVGAYAIQFARLYGAGTVIATASSEEKAGICRDLGADVVIDYRKEDVAARVAEITGGRGADLVVEVDAAANVGTLAQIIAQDGSYAVYGSGSPQVAFDFMPMITRGVTVRFFIVYELAGPLRERLVSALNAHLAAGHLRHAVARTYALDEIVAAHEAVESGKVIGNVVLSIA